MQHQAENPAYCIILNPRAGRGLAGQQQPTIEQAMQAAGLSFDLWQTSGPGSARHLAHAACQQGYQHIVAVGGDGSISDVAHGLLATGLATGQPAADLPTLGIIPIGTGNDFVRSLPGFVPNDIPGAIARLARGQTRCIDAGRITVLEPSPPAAEAPLPRFLINNLALGIEAPTAWYANQFTWARGFAAYLFGALLALLRHTPAPIHIRYQTGTQSTFTEWHEWHEPFLVVSVTNGTTQGGGFRLTPAAQLDDGLLDMCVVEPLRLDQSLRYLPRALKGTHGTMQQVRLAQVRTVEVAYSQPTLVIADGEVIGHDVRRLRVDVLPGALRLLV